MAGAAAGFNEDFNNRQLHPAEAQLIRGNARAYAAKRGIPVEQATTELTEQSLRQIDSAWAKRIVDNPQAAAFLREIAQSSGPADVGGGSLFDARGTSPYTDHTINAGTLGQTSDLYNRITDRNASGIVPSVRGAYVAYADAGTDPRLAQNTPEQIQQLLDTGRQLRQQGQTVLTGLPSEGGAVTTPTRGMRPGTGDASASGEGRPKSPGLASDNQRTGGATCSFRGDMLVKTSAGYVQIKDIQVGDSVYARDEGSGESAYKAVLAHYGNPYRETVYVSARDAAGRVQVIVSNVIHPFFAQVPGIEAGTVLPKASEGHDYRGPIAHAQWIDAGNLKIGYRLLGSAGRWLEVSGLERTQEPLQAYNLTVADFHTYFIRGESGQEGVWVHNDCWSALPKEAIATGKTTPDGRLLYTFKGADGKKVTAYQGKDGDTRWYDPRVYAPDLPVPRGIAVKSPPESVVVPPSVLPPVPSRADQASALGYDRQIAPQRAPFNSHGQEVYFDGKNYITPDIDAHNVSGGWKMFNLKGKRIGTYPADLKERIKK